MKIAIALHDVSSTSRLADFVRTLLAFDLNIDMVVFSRVSGAAAQYGLAEASKTLFKKGIRFLILQDIEDYHDVFGGYKVIQYSASYGKPISSSSDLGLSDEDKVILMFSGSDVGFSSKEMIEGSIAIRSSGAPRELPPESALGIVLNLLSKIKLI
jgi:SpoU rRNA methylase family enzyme|uniref:Exonuclease n=1 Tax=Fervidicoccus fontis TaxID=683846 RepID=A0A7J3SKK9_9CREN